MVQSRGTALLVSKSAIVSGESMRARLSHGPLLWFAMCGDPKSHLSALTQKKPHIPAQSCAFQCVCLAIVRHFLDFVQTCVRMTHACFGVLATWRSLARRVCPCLSLFLFIFLCVCLSVFVSVFLCLSLCLSLFLCVQTLLHSCTLASLVFRLVRLT